MKQSSFSTNFCIAELFNLDYVFCFYKTKKELSSAIFTIKILVAETFGLDRELKYFLGTFHMQSSMSVLHYEQLRRAPTSDNDVIFL